MKLGVEAWQPGSLRAWELGLIFRVQLQEQPVRHRVSVSFPIQPELTSSGVAENFLLEAECIEYFTKAFAANFLASDLSYGDSLWGSRRINAALAGFLNRCVLGGS